ncbi:hypothetical protein SDC9_151571 [bioreactor metagenome]|uniref:Uncharacterized protein n=1 Tax=bioreactor metagenome TaxID=1076179 RepID=A0A645EV20_9ZZZZ
MILPLLLDGLQNFPDAGNVAGFQGGEGLAHVTQLQPLADVQHFGNRAVLFAGGGEDDVLKNRIEAELHQDRSPAGLSGYHAQQFHGLDGFSHHIAADLQHIGQGLFRRQQIAGLKIILQDVRAYLPKHPGVQLFPNFLVHAGLRALI